MSFPMITPDNVSLQMLLAMKRRNSLSQVWMKNFHTWSHLSMKCLKRPGDECPQLVVS